MAGNGLRLARSQGMEGYTGNTREYGIDPTNSNAIFTGDPVVLSGGYIVAATSTTAAILGIFMGCRFVAADGSYEFRNQWDGTANRTSCFATVAIPASGMCWIKGNSGVTFAEATSVGATHPFVIAAGNAQYGDSRWALGAPGAGPVIVHRLVDIPGNTWGNTEPVLEVSVNLQAGTYSSAA